MLPRVLKNFNIYVGGESFAGRAEKCKLPDLKIKTDPYRGAGMDGVVELDMGMELIELQMTFAEHNPNLIRLLGLHNSQTPISVRGGLQRQGEQAIGMEVRVVGGVRELNRDEWTAGERAGMVLVVSCNTYIERQAGIELVNIDIINGRRIIDGVDQVAGMRAALAL